MNIFKIIITVLLAIFSVLGLILSFSSDKIATRISTFLQTLAMCAAIYFMYY